LSLLPRKTPLATSRRFAKASKPLSVRVGYMLLPSTLISAAIVISLPLPIQAHEIYSHLTDKEGKSCCDKRDCQPAGYRLTQRGVKMLVDRRWIDAPSGTIQYLSLPGDNEQPVAATGVEKPTR
jgi:hypothetical protein